MRDISLKWKYWNIDVSLFESYFTPFGRSITYSYCFFIFSSFNLIEISIISNINRWRTISYSANNNNKYSDRLHIWHEAPHQLQKALHCSYQPGSEGVFTIHKELDEYNIRPAYHHCNEVRLDFVFLTPKVPLEDLRPMMHNPIPTTHKASLII